MVAGADTLRRIEIKFTFIITFSAIATLALLGITWWYWSETKSIKDTLVFFSIGAAAVGQITASFYTARVLSATLRKDDRDAHRAEQEEARYTAWVALERKRASLKFGERWNDPGMFPARDALRLVHKHQGSSDDDELRKFIDSKETEVMHVINFIEEIGTACRHEVVDAEIMREQFDDIVVSTWRKLYPWIEKKRIPNKDIWEDFERLFYKWK